jgi:hypothetical protein
MIPDVSEDAPAGTAHRVQRCDSRHKPDFGGKSEAFLSARQHQPDGQNPIASQASPENAARAWLRNWTSNPERRHAKIS